MSLTKRYVKPCPRDSKVGGSVVVASGVRCVSLVPPTQTYVGDVYVASGVRYVSLVPPTQTYVVAWWLRGWVGGGVVGGTRGEMLLLVDHYSHKLWKPKATR